MAPTIRSRRQELLDELAFLDEKSAKDKCADERSFYGNAGTTQAMCSRQETPQEKIDYLFTFHDNPDKAPHYTEIRESAKQFALCILRHGSAGSKDQITAIEYVRQAVMFANASVALDGRNL